MSVKASISLTESQEAYARDLVKNGHYPSLSAVLQQGLELLREKSRATDALREVLDARRSGPFVSTEEGRQSTSDIIARKRAERGL